MAMRGKKKTKKGSWMKDWRSYSGWLIIRATQHAPRWISSGLLSRTKDVSRERNNTTGERKEVPNFGRRGLQSLIKKGG